MTRKNLHKSLAVAGLLAALASCAALAHTGILNPIEETEIDGDVEVYMKSTISGPANGGVFHTGGTASMNVTYGADHRVVLTGDGTQAASNWGVGGALWRGGYVNPLNIKSASRTVAASSILGVSWQDSTAAVHDTPAGGQTCNADTLANHQTTGYSDHMFTHSHGFTVSNP